MPEDRLITLAIHTFERATILKTILESEGIQVALQNVNLLQPVVSSGVRVRIHEEDLPKALRIIENSDIFTENSAALHSDTQAAPVVLVPVDFSVHSTNACKIAFKFAESYGAEILLLHSFISPSIASSFQLTNALNFDFDEVPDDELRVNIEESAQKRLDEFARSLRDMMSAGTLPPVKFSTRLVDDVPEDAINAVSKEVQPRLIVMGTRGAGKKESDMIGSVTAEVLDTCRFPVFTVPDNLASFNMPGKDCHVVFFCNYEQSDLIALDMFYRLFPDCVFKVTLVNVPSRKTPANAESLSDGLMKYCREHLPHFIFDIKSITINDMEAEFQQIEKDLHIDFIAVSNKKRNIFSRLFNPGLAHRLLFHTDIPMIVLPV